MKAIALIVLLVAATAGAFWAGRRMGPAGVHEPAASTNATRRLRFYQSPMHPWITSPEPGNCTICGMKLVPIYEGDAEASPVPGTVKLQSNSMSVIGIATRPVVRRRLARTLRLAGTLDDNDARHRILAAAVEGRMEAIHVHHPGAEVEEGTILAELYSPPLLTAAREHVALAKSGAVASMLEASAVRLRQLGMTARQVSELPTTLRADQRTLPWMSPMGGTVVRRMAFAGQWVREGEPLFEIADFSVMWVQLDAYEADLAWLKPGQEVVLSTPSVPGRLLTHRIAFIDPNLDPMTRIARVRVEVPNPLVDGVRLLRHKAFVEGRVRVEAPPALVVPRPAVLNPGGAPFAFVELAPGQYQARRLRLGRVGDDAFEVLEGLAENEVVVVQGGLLLDVQSQLQDGSASGAGDASSGGDAVANAPASSVEHRAWGPETDDARRALADFLKATATASEALASDDLAAFNQAVPAIQGAAEALGKLGVHAPPTDLFPSKVATAPDLAAARRAFHQWTTPWLATAKALRGTRGFDGLRLIKCPMTSKSFPGAPATATWWQWQAPVRNPWFGKDMLDCGTLLP